MKLKKENRTRTIRFLGIMLSNVFQTNKTNKVSSLSPKKVMQFFFSVIILVIIYSISTQLYSTTSNWSFSYWSSRPFSLLFVCRVDMSGSSKLFYYYYPNVFQSHNRFIYEAAVKMGAKR
ncbi:hypothetical protein DERP_003732 [Dermatophagoides pteronyssinus]|uniref:Uncharacterized protein n=1 Tax=Dermatophagoides pteronyssinus TaxID=6956 RepID=A0ABQ8JM10_DERPT|nr:hypothetical protein DERP_003732 [Dermatophagoides pteronyssinus]